MANVLDQADHYIHGEETQLSAISQRSGGNVPCTSVSPATSDTTVNGYDMCIRGQLEVATDTDMEQDIPESPVSPQ